MYHYVRDLTFTRYPGIKGLDYRLFQEQVLYLERNYNFVTVEQVIAAYSGHEKLPKKAVLLTFDDGYIDHFTKVFPFLHSRKIQGAFYPPALAITEHAMLDVNKIHFILAATNEVGLIIKEIEVLLRRYKDEYNLKSFQYYFDKLAISNRFDSKEVIFIKRLLQVELEESIRIKFTDEIFLKIVGIDLDVFSRELYMDVDQLKCMVANGMHVGSHGFNHYWLGSLKREEQEIEIVKSMDFIKQIGGNIDNWTICYPYGNYNEDTISLLNEYKCCLGFSTEVNLANIETQNNLKFKIPRLDTNDFPKYRDAEVNDWFFKAN